ncbi:MAG: DUF4105 domain-containing protein [Polyangiaceae bacterium]|nr:DUF4105 domain-containing protein [Polyangiaceae bacterium]
MSRFLHFVLGLFAIVATVAASPSAANAEAGDEYTISLITMSPGDPIFFRFGHNALLVREARRGTQDVYNWGTFSFNEPGLVSKFLRGRLTYWLSVQPLEPTLLHYDSEKRWLAEQVLNLTSAQKRELVAKLRRNAQPALREVSSGPAQHTYRQHTSRLVADIGWGYVFLNLAMGSYIDQPVTAWDEMFVPEKVRETLRKVQNVNERGESTPLVMAERMLVEAPARKAPPDAPPNRMLPLLGIGLVVGGLLGLLGYRLTSWNHPVAKTPLGRRLALALPLGAWTTLTGFLGLLFLFFWFATDHEVAYHNENLLQTSPLTAAFPVIAVGILLDRRWARRAFMWLSYAVAGLSVLGLLCEALPWFNQVNGEMIAFLMPMWLGLAAGPALAARKARPPSKPAELAADAPLAPAER